jgi:hypothetical protein
MNLNDRLKMAMGDLLLQNLQAADQIEQQKATIQQLAGKLAELQEPADPAAEGEAK